MGDKKSFHHLTTKKSKKKQGLEGQGSSSTFFFFGRGNVLGRHIGEKSANPVLPFLVFLEFLVFWPCKEFLVFLSVFPFFSRDFRGSVGIKIPCFFGGFPCHFPKKQGKEGQGSSRKSGGKILKHSMALDLFPLSSEGPERGGRIRRGWIWRFRGAPIFSPEVPHFKISILGPLD